MECEYIDSLWIYIPHTSDTLYSNMAADLRSFTDFFLYVQWVYKSHAIVEIVLFMVMAHVHVP